MGFTDKKRVFGESAQTQYLRNMRNTITNIKTVLGRAFNDEVTQRELKRSPSLVAVPVGASGDDVGFEVSLTGQTQQFSATTVAGMYLRHLKVLMERHLKTRVEDVVISVPSHWSVRQRRALADAARIAGLNPLRLLHETTATALQYGFYRQKELPDDDGGKTPPQTVLFVDHGYAHTTATIVQFSKGKLRVVASECDGEFGGRDIDQVLFDHFAAEFVAKFKVDVRTNVKAADRVLQACDKTKKMISSTPTAPISVDCVMNDVDVKGLITKEQFDELLAKANVAARLLAPVKRAMAAAGLDGPDKLFSCEITGSGLRLTQLQRVLQDWFGRELSRHTNAEESVARGCALQCAMLSPVFKVRDFAIADVTPLPIVIKWHPTGQPAAEEAIDVFTVPVQIPSSKFVTLPQINDYNVRAEYQNAPPHIAPLVSALALKSAPIKHPEGVGKIKLKVTLNPSGIFVLEQAEQTETYTVEEDVPVPADAKPADTKPAAAAAERKADDAPADTATPAAVDGAAAAAATPEAPKTQKVQKKKVHSVALQVDETAPGALSKRALELAVEDEQKFVAQDNLAAQTADAKNAVETYIYAMRDKLENDYKEYSTDAERSSLSTLLQSTEDWLYEDGEDVTKSVYDAKLADMKSTGDKVAARHQEAEVDRPTAVKALQQLAQEFLLRAKTDLPEYAHISDADKQTVVKSSEEALKWLNDSIDAQLKKAKTAEPVVKAIEIDSRRKTLEVVCRPIMNQPKPKPKVEEKPAEPKKDEQPPKKDEPAADKPADTAEPMAEDKPATDL